MHFIFVYHGVKFSPIPAWIKAAIAYINSRLPPRLHPLRWVCKTLAANIEGCFKSGMLTWANHIYHLLAKHWNKHADQTDNYLLRSNDYPCTTDSGQHDGGILVQIWAYFNISLYEYCQPPQKQSKPELSHYQKPGVSLYWYVMRSFNFSDKFRSYYLQFT